MKVGIIGCGAVTQQLYARLLRGLPGFNVSVVSDIQKSNSEKVAKLLDCRVGTQENVIQDCELVVVATPPATHFEIAQKCLTAGRHVVVEKPFATSVEDAATLVALAERADRQLFVAHFRRYFPKLPLARGLVRGGVIGPVVGIRMYEGGRFSWGVASKYITESPWGGVILDTGSHTLDMALYAAGLDDRPMSTIRVKDVQKDKEEPSHEISGRFLMDFGGTEIEGVLKLSRYGPMANMVRILGERGALEFGVGHEGGIVIRGLGEEIRLEATEKLASFETAFQAQYVDVLKSGNDCRLRGSRFLNQMKILHALTVAGMAHADRQSVTRA